MEFAGRFDISPSEIASAGAGGTVERILALPSSASRWSLVVKPEVVGAGPFTLPTAQLLYWTAGDFYPINPPVSVGLAFGRATVVSRGDSPSKIKLLITNPGSQIQDGGILVSLYADRGAQ